MGKIQAVICPQCGSSNAANLEDDKFRCNNCHTAFFIDKEKVEVHVRHSFETEKPFNPAAHSKPPVKVVGTVLIAFAVLIVTAFVMSSFFPKKAVQSGSPGVFADGNGDDAKKVLIAFSNNEPRLFVLSESVKRNQNYELSENNVLLKMYEPAERKLIKEIEIIPPISYKEFDQGGYSDHHLSLLGDTIWYLNGKSRIFSVDPNSLKVKETNASLTAQFKELASGIGSIEQLSYEKGFKIQNNNGASYFYFPLENKLYSEDEYGKSKDGITGKSLVKRFTFEEINRPTGHEQMKKLYQMKRFESEGGPGMKCVECIYFELEDLKAGRNLSAKSEVREVKEFTPERSYFDGHYLYNDDEELLISFKRVANEKDAPVIQCLDADGNTKWTVETKNLSNAKNNVTYSQYSSDVFKANDVYYLAANYYAAAIGKDGQVLWSYNILNRDGWK